MVDIQVKNLTKFFVIGENLLEGLSFEIQEGERVAILGRNGCGKTTLFNILTGQMDYDAGEVYVNPNKRLGLISQIPYFPEGFTVDEIIDLFVKNGVGTKEGFIEAINNYPYKHEFVRILDENGWNTDRVYRLEGYLYPDTYDFYENSSPRLALEKMLDGLEGVTGEDSGLDGLIDGAIEANREAEALNDGWPSTLRAYPGGEANAVASYRTEISGTTLEEMMGWIEDLKKDGFAYQDFYDFGMTEQDMLDMNGWWAYDGKTYLSVSFYEGTVTVDHTKELPDLESYFN